MVYERIWSEEFMEQTIHGSSRWIHEVNGFQEEW
jgi:hypothetical protein